MKCYSSNIWKDYITGNKNIQIFAKSIFLIYNILEKINAWKRYIHFILSGIWYPCLHRNSLHSFRLAKYFCYCSIHNENFCNKKEIAVFFAKDTINDDGKAYQTRRVSYIVTGIFGIIWFEFALFRGWAPDLS